MKKKAIIPVVFSQCSNPVDLVQKPGDELSYRINKEGTRIAKLHTSDFKRSKVVYSTGKTVETISY